MKFFIYNFQNFSVFYCRSGKVHTCQPTSYKLPRTLLSMTTIKMEELSGHIHSPEVHAGHQSSFRFSPFSRGYDNLEGVGGGTYKSLKKTLSLIVFSRAPSWKVIRTETWNLEASDLTLSPSETKWVGGTYSISRLRSVLCLPAELYRETPGSRF